MKVTTIKTKKLIPFTDTLDNVLDQYIVTCPEGSILVITSKIVAICEGNVVEMDGTDKLELIHEESEYYLPPDSNSYNVSLTIKQNVLAAAAGIDESNGAGYYILWPKSSQRTANRVRTYLQKRFNIMKIGVVITDSKSSPLRWGTTGIAIAHSGFSALNNYIGTPDIFGRYMKMTQSNIMDGLAMAAVLVMGEGKEQTPLALIEDVPFVKFQNRNPSREELNRLGIDIDDDIYSSVLKGANWIKGRG